MWVIFLKFKLYVSLRICLLWEKDVLVKFYFYVMCLNFDFDLCIIG